MGKQGKINIPMMLACVLLCLTLISMHLTGGLFARYVSTAESSDSARVAKFSILGEKSEDITIECGNADNGEYTVTVKNQSEVAVTYGIAIRFDEELNDKKLSITLKEGETEKAGQLSDDSKTVEYGTLGSLAPGGEQAYTLMFTVDDWSYVTEEATGLATQVYSKELNFHVDIHAEQID
jgi:hypothetical protein